MDDKPPTARVPNEKNSLAKILLVFPEVEEWAQENKMTFEAGKFEAIYFPQRHLFENPDIDLPPSFTCNPGFENPHCNLSCKTRSFKRAKSVF